MLKKDGCGVIVLIVAACFILASIFLSREMNHLFNWLIH